MLCSPHTWDTHTRARAWLHNYNCVFNENYRRISAKHLASSACCVWCLSRHKRFTLYTASSWRARIEFETKWNYNWTPLHSFDSHGNKRLRILTHSHKHTCLIMLTTMMKPVIREPANCSTLKIFAIAQARLFQTSKWPYTAGTAAHFRSQFSQFSKSIQVKMKSTWYNPYYD